MKKYTLSGLKAAITKKFTAYKFDDKDGYYFFYLKYAFTANEVFDVQEFVNNIPKASLDTIPQNEGIYCIIIVPYSSVK